MALSIRGEYPNVSKLIAAENYYLSYFDFNVALIRTILDKRIKFFEKELFNPLTGLIFKFSGGGILIGIEINKNYVETVVRINNTKINYLSIALNSTRKKLINGRQAFITLLINQKFL